MAKSKQPSLKRKYRLYVDESGNPDYNDLDNPRRRYLCLVGCAMQNKYYHAQFQPALDAIKRLHFPEHYSNDPDSPVIFHRTDIMQRRGPFWVLREDKRRNEFDGSILAMISQHRFGVFTVVLDKQAHIARHGSIAKHPYHYCLIGLLDLYCQYLNAYNGEGDVLAESRNRNEDTQLKSAYADVYRSGTWENQEKFFQAALTSNELKLKKKEANVAGLQLADMIAHPSKFDVLKDHGVECEDGSFGDKVRKVIAAKYAPNPIGGGVMGYGKLFL